MLAVFAQVPAGFFGIRWLSAALLLGFAALLLLIPPVRRRITGAGTSDLPFWWGPAVVYWPTCRCPRCGTTSGSSRSRWDDGAARKVHIDTYFHLAMAGELAERGPSDYPWVDGQRLSYHWFSHPGSPRSPTPPAWACRRCCSGCSR